MQSVTETSTPRRSRKLTSSSTPLIERGLAPLGREAAKLATAAISRTDASFRIAHLQIATQRFYMSDQESTADAEEAPAPAPFVFVSPPGRSRTVPGDCK